MTKSEFLKLASEQWDKIESHKKSSTNLYDYNIFLYTQKGRLMALAAPVYGYLDELNFQLTYYAL